MDDISSRLSYQRDNKNCNILSFTDSWLNNDMDNIELAGFSVHQEDREATSGKTSVSICVYLCLFLEVLLA